MDNLTFISNLIGSLAWPTAVLVLALAFREQVKDILRRVTKVEALGVTAELDNKLNLVEEQAEKADLPPASNLAIAHDGRPASSRIFESWQELESKLNYIFFLKNGHHPRSYSVIREFLSDLGRKGMVPKESFSIFQQLRSIRNQAVHPQSGDPSVTSLEADKFADLTSRLVDQLKLLEEGEPLGGEPLVDHETAARERQALETRNAQRAEAFEGKGF